MGKVEKGVISFEGYDVKSVNFKLNDDYDGSDVTIDMGVGVSISYNTEEQKMIVNLDLIIFENAEENNYPFEMSLSLRGYFGLSDEKEENLKKYRANAVAILFPYARALVSTYTANSNVSPLILPTVNINKMLRNSEDNNK